MENTETNNSEEKRQADEKIFKPISGEESAQEVTEVESYCVNCGENGVTKLLLTSIPFYKEVILASFSCPHCHFQNNEIQSAGEIQKLGIHYILEVNCVEDLNRQVIKSDYASVQIPQLDLEIPPQSQKGEITTLEGILQRITTGLKQDQDRRKVEHPEDYAKIETFLSKVEQCIKAELPFTLILKDISGNSFISTKPSVLPGQKDESLQLLRFERTTEENNALGLYEEANGNADEEDTASSGQHGKGSVEEGSSVGEDQNKTEDGDLELHNEVLEFQTLCPDCGAACTTKMKLTRIPHFKEVVVMATDCEKCGSRTNEVKSGSGIEEKGRRFILRVTSVDDLCRDVLKSETCSVEIPELKLEVGSGTLGGKFTTLEGLLCNVKDQLAMENPLISGDSAQPEMKAKMEQFCQEFDRLMSCEVPFTVILDDPAGNSYLQNVYAPDDDPEMKIEDYERTFQQNEELGLNDMNTEEYSRQ